ncbi:MAG: hypothetical protein ACK4S4_15080 [Pyrinomonadaceae bacterium]
MATNGLLFRITRKARIALPIVCVFAGTIVFASGQTPSASPVPSPKPTPKMATGELDRWLSIDALSVSTRYRFVNNRAGRTTSNQNQWQFVGRGRFKFDPKGKYSVAAALATGGGITSGWNNTGWGTGDGQSNIYLKQLYFNAKPVKWLEVQVGGIAPTNGENTEITGYDNDVYIMGARVQVRRPKDLWFDEISATNAYIGDNNRPNVFRRFKRMDESNYRQLLVRKQVNKRVGFSADYTFESGRDTLRQAVNIKTPELVVVDRVLFENYQRVDPDRGYGFHLFGDKKVNKRLTLGGGFARIDRPMLNADRYPQGSRLHFDTALKISRELSLSTAVIRAVGPLPAPSSTRTRVDVILTLNILESLHRLKIY